MKRITFWICFTLAAVIFYMNRDKVATLYYEVLKFFSPADTTVEKNDYYREYDFMYVQNTINFEPQDVQDIMNIFYTVINSGVNEFTFYCPSEYTNCTEDIKALANDQTKLSHINNYVHPYNGFKHIETQYTSHGEVTIIIEKSYTSDDILAIDAKVKEISNSLLSNVATDIEKIKIIHDYIINNSKYDTARGEQNVVSYKSDIAYGPLLQHYGICGGYSDAMQLFLEELGIKSYRVSSETHVWNAVNLNGAWYHLDLTWDDPVTPNYTDVLDHEYFLISTGELLSKGTVEHNFERSIYLEL